MRIARVGGFGGGVLLLGLVCGAALAVLQSTMPPSVPTATPPRLADLTSYAMALPTEIRVVRKPTPDRLSRVVAGDQGGAYLAWLDRTVLSVDDATSTLLDLEGEPARDASWSLRVTGTVSVWTSAYHNAMAEQPPFEFVSDHVAVVDAFRLYNDAAASVLQGANEGNDNLIAKGVDQALSGRSAVMRALAVLQSRG